MIERPETAASQDRWGVTAEEVIAFDPDWVIFWGESIVNSQLETWVPYLRRSRYRYLIVSSIDEANPKIDLVLDGVSNAMFAVPFETIRAALKKCPRLMGIIYPTTRAPNFSMVTQFPRRAHVWVGHGESEKGVNGPRTASLYDSVLVARYSAVKRFPRAIRPWVGDGACAIGAPILDGAVKSPWLSPRPVKTIIYAPTWEGRRAGADYSSLPEVMPVMRTLLPKLRERGVTVILRPHPGTGRRVPEYKELIRELYAAGAVKPGSKVEGFGAADLMLSDVSGVNAEFLFTEKPLIIPVTTNAAARGKDASTLAREYPWGYQWQVGSEDLLALLDGLASSDPLRAKRSSSASAMYRGHRTLDEAVRTFDLALAATLWRRSRIGVRLAFEVSVRTPWLFRLAGRIIRFRKPGTRGRANRPA